MDISWIRGAFIISAKSVVSLLLSGHFCFQITEPLCFKVLCLSLTLNVCDVSLFVLQSCPEAWRCRFQGGNQEVVWGRQPQDVPQGERREVKHASPCKAVPPHSVLCWMFALVLSQWASKSVLSAVCQPYMCLKLKCGADVCLQRAVACRIHESW